MLRSRLPTIGVKNLRERKEDRKLNWPSNKTRDMEFKEKLSHTWTEKSELIRLEVKIERIAPKTFYHHRKARLVNRTLKE